jgi:hypothetical protein
MIIAAAAKGVVPPPGAPDGQQYGINLVASDQGGRPVGGVTVFLTIAR